jgi:phage gp36-like protein
MSEYCTADDVKLVFGAKNVLAWADVEGDGSRVDERITFAITVASSEVDSVLTGSPMRIPLPSVPTLLRAVTATLAGVRLYESRGIMGVSGDGSSVAHPYVASYRWAMSVLEDVKAGRRRIT